MTELTLEQAAIRVGVPAGVLHQWAWAKAIQTANNRLWSPTFDQAVVDQFIAEHRKEMDRAIS